MVRAIVAVQLAIAAALVCLMALLGARQAAAAALGAAVCIAPTALFARAAASGRGGRLLAYGLAKSMAIVGLMALCFAAVRPEPLGFVCAVAAVHLAYVAAPLLGRHG